MESAAPDPALSAAPGRRRARARRLAPSLERLDPRSDRPLEQQVYASLRTALIEGRVPSGTGLSVRSLAEALGVSPAPVRDALKRLEADGALQARPRSAFYTPPVSLDEYDQILAVRLELEGYAAGLAAERATAGDVAAIEAARGAYAAELGRGNPSSISRANQAFHFAIYRAAQNPVLMDLISNLWVRLGPVLARVWIDRDHALRDHHGRALAAIRAHDSAAARDAVREDLSDAAQLIRATIISMI